MHSIRHRHRRQRGQFIPIVAIAATVLIGAAALAVDLSLQTHDQRTLQNVSDAAALAGAQDLPASPVAADQYQGAQDALQLIRNRMGWQSLKVGGSGVTNSAWAQILASPCSPAFSTGSPSVCDDTKTVCSNAVPAPGDLPATCDSYAALSNNAHYFTITIQSPAKTSQIISQTDRHYFEVTMAQDTQNYIAGILGRATSTQGSRSTAYHAPPDQPFGFALFAKTVVATQNKSTLVVGDVYADRSVDPQSSGKAGFCAAGGLIILGSPQLPESYDAKADPGQADILPKSASPIIYDTSICNATTNTTGKGSVVQGRDPQAGCTVVGVPLNAVYDSNSQIRACVAKPPLAAPTMAPPTLSNPNASYGCVTVTTASQASPGHYTCNANKTSALAINQANAQLAPGVYVITHNPTCVPTNCYDVDFSQSTTLTGVTLWLDQGATVGVHGNGTAVSINPSPSVMNLSPSDGRFPIYAPPGSVAQVYVTNLGANLQLYGTLYVPDGVAHASQNASFTINGQAIVGTWDDQGGDHPSADITYDATRNAPQVEVLKLVE